MSFVFYENEEILDKKILGFLAAYYLGNVKLQHIRCYNNVFWVVEFIAVILKIENDLIKLVLPI